MVALWVRMGYYLHMPGSGHHQTSESMTQTPRLADRFRQLIDEMKEADRRQQAVIDDLLRDTQKHLAQLERYMKDN